MIANDDGDQSPEVEMFRKDLGHLLTVADALGLLTPAIYIQMAIDMIDQHKPKVGKL